MEYCRRKYHYNNYDPIVRNSFKMYLKNEQNKVENFYDFQKLISNYIEDASNKQLWVDLLSLTNLIIKKKTSKNELIQKANQYIDQDKKTFKSFLFRLCLLFTE